MATSKIKSTEPRKRKAKPRGETQASSNCGTNTAKCGASPTSIDDPCAVSGPPLLSLQHCVQSISGCLEDLEMVRELAKSQLQQAGITDNRRRICSDIVVDTSKATANLWGALYPVK